MVDSAERPSERGVGAFLALPLTPMIAFAAWYGGLFFMRALIHNYDSAFIPVIGFGLLTLAGLLAVAAGRLLAQAHPQRHLLRRLYVVIIYALPSLAGAVKEIVSF